MVLATTCAPLSLTLGSNAARGTTVRMLMMTDSELRCWDLVDGDGKTQVETEQHREEAVEITTWPMCLGSQFSSMRLREADITGSVEDIAD